MPVGVNGNPLIALKPCLAGIFDRLAESADEDPSLNIEHRVLKAKRKAGGIVWFDFQTLCGGPRSQNDYLEISRGYHTVLLSHIPKMTAHQASEARRFTWLVDVFYDHRVKLLVSAECQAYDLYVEGRQASEFHRTVSRLIEMRSRDYLAEAHRVD